MPNWFREQLRNTAFAATLEKKAIIDLFSTKTPTASTSTDNEHIVIVGGELFNKGAQAMTFTVVDQMSRRYPEKEIHLLSGEDYQRPSKEKSQYEFEILPWGTEVQLSLLSPKLNFVNTSIYPKSDLKRTQEVISNSAYMIDINGYALTSQFGFQTSFAYMANIIIAKEYNIPMYILPQSIGPFSYSIPNKLILNPLFHIYLSYPRKIYPREQAGVTALQAYTRANVQQEPDIVLQYDEYDLKNIYATKLDFTQKNIENEAVGIVPNSKVFERADSDWLYGLYESIIHNLLSAGKKIYVLRHSVEDLKLCQNIKQNFESNKHVVLLDDDFNAIELEQIIEQFDFLVGSRYHSIVHAYKNSVPVIAIGWAEKYRELLNEFNQSDYFFEGRKQINKRELITVLNNMCDSHTRESKIIHTKLNEIQQKRFL